MPSIKKQEMFITQRVTALGVSIRPSFQPPCYLMRKYPFVYLSKSRLNNPFYGLKFSSLRGSLAHQSTYFMMTSKNRSLFNYFYFFYRGRKLDQLIFAHFCRELAIHSIEIVEKSDQKPACQTFRPQEKQKQLKSGRFH